MRSAILISFALVLSACASTDTSNGSARQMSGMEMYQRIAQRDGGEFPTEDVRRTIDGRWDLRSIQVQ
jgi:hypothetical protein